MDKIINYIKNKARPLEKSMYLYYFETGSKEDVIQSLKLFQNEDGGFGHGLEPDFLNPNSNPIDSWKAAKILDDLKLDKNHEMIQSLIQYFINTKDKDDWNYYFRVKTNNDYPHAPWWHYEENNKINGYNPTVSILGFLYKYLDINHPVYKKIEKTIDEAIGYLMNNDISEMHELVCFNEFYEYSCDQIDCSIMHQRLLFLNTKAIEKDTSKWLNSYCAKPTQIFVSMHSPGVREMMHLIHEELKMSFDHRNQEGVFDITWDWNQYPDDFNQAKEIWKGIIALKMLRVSQEYQFLKNQI
jgi:hypothetical protein